MKKQKVRMIKEISDGRKIRGDRWVVMVKEMQKVEMTKLKRKKN